MTQTPPCSFLRVPAAKPPITLVRHARRFADGAVLAIVFVALIAVAEVPSASSQGVTYAGSGAVNFGSANVCPLGKIVPAPCSQSLTLTYNVTASGTLGTPLALTTGAPNLDFTLASGSTCSGSVVKGNACTVNVTFAPIAPGARNGAVEIVDANNSVLATTYIYANGAGPLIGFGPPEWRTLPYNAANGFIVGVAVDASGNVFVADEGNHVIKEMLAVNGSIPADPIVRVLEEGDIQPTSLAVDGAGNVFFSNSLPMSNHSNVEEILAADSYATTRIVGTGIISAYDVAVDGSGNVFVIDTDPFIPSSSLKEIFAAGDYTTTKTLGGGFEFVNAVTIALDGSENAFVADNQAPDGPVFGVVDEIMATSGYTTVKTIHVSSKQASAPGYVAVDPAGNLFAVLTTGIWEFFAINGVLPPNPAALSFGLGQGSPLEIAMDGRGNMFIADVETDMVRELQFSIPPPLVFATTVVGQTSSDSPQSVQVQNQGNAPLSVTGLSVSPNWNQISGSGSPADCTADLSLVPSALCNLNINFKPMEQGPLIGAATLVDKTLNAPGSTQSVPLSGTGIAAFTPPHIASLNWTYGAPYSVVLLYGSYFGATQGRSTVTFNGIATPHYYWANTKIYVTVPPDATTGSLVVTVGGEASNAIPFTVLPMPVLTGISPTTGPAGTVVTISGRNLVDFENKGTVTFNGNLCPFSAKAALLSRSPSPPEPPPVTSTSW